MILQALQATNANGEPVRQVGAVLWDTTTGEWQVRGQAADLRDCTPNQKNQCTPPYFYAMSNDGKKQFYSYPTTELLDNGQQPIRYKPIVATANTGSPTCIQISGTGNVRTLDTNADGDLLLINIVDGSYEVDAGYAIY